MALKHILERIGSSKGFKPFTDEDERKLLVKKINEAAFEIYCASDLEHSLMEQIFDIDVSSHQVVLPPYAGWYRASRYCDSRIEITTETYIPRYHHGSLSKEAWPYKFRELPKRGLAKDISNQSILKISIPQENGAQFTLILIGSNSNSSNFKEEITFSATDLEKQTTNIFNSVELFKEDKTKYDITIKDVDDNELAIFPNYETELKHIALQISDADNVPDGISAIECLFKLRYIPLVDDYDVFQCGSQYEDSIYWKFRELYALDKESENNPATFAGKSAKLTSNQDAQQSEGHVKRINYGINPVLNVFSMLRNKGR